MTNKIISKLIFFGYPNAKRQLILGLALLSFLSFDMEASFNEAISQQNKNN